MALKRRVDKALAVIHLWCMALRLYTLRELNIIPSINRINPYKNNYN